jgi:SAM-dependent methyltransferase
MAAAVLNLGAGNRIIADAVNHDLVQHRPEIAVAWDLNNLPWPWPDNSFGLIWAWSVLEHLRLNLVESLDECWRILRPSGQVFLKIPYWKSDAAYDDPTHRWVFGLHSLDQFDPDTERGKTYSYYTARKWKLIKLPEPDHCQSSIIATLEVRK